jgi:hypothetical protein
VNTENLARFDRIFHKYFRENFDTFQ